LNAAFVFCREGIYVESMYGNKIRMLLVNNDEEKSTQERCWSFDVGISSSNARKIIFTVLLGVALAITFDKCISCVFVILILSGLTMSCIPTMPIVFLLCCGVLLMHAIDYRNASIRVEVPLENFVYIPTWDDVHKYVHVSANEAGGASKNAMNPLHPDGGGGSRVVVPAAAPAPSSPSFFSWFDSEEKL